jgi:hypothetical protein
VAIHFGTKLMGKVDEVPRVGYVSTKFIHVNFLPLIPTGSYFVLDEQGDNFQGVPVPISFKSIAVAWLRSVTFFMFLFGVIFCIIAFSEQKTSQAILTAGVAIAGVVLFAASYYIPLVSRASYQRAMDLAERVGLSDEVVLMVEVAYGRKSAEEADLELERIDERRREQETVRVE